MEKHFLSMSDAYVHALQDPTGTLSHAPFVEAKVNEHHGFIGTKRFDFGDVVSILEKVPAIETFSSDAKRDMAKGILHHSYIRTLENVFFEKNEDSFSGTDIYIDNENESTIMIAVFVPDDKADNIDKIAKKFNEITPELVADAFAIEHLRPYAMCLNIERLTKHIWTELQYAVENGEEEPSSSYQAIIVDGTDAENTVSISVKACLKEEGNASSGGTSRWKWLVDGQYFDSDKFAAKYLLRRIEEIRSGIRIFDHEKQAVPAICGVEGRACRHPNACNSALCSHCPVAEEFFAKRDGILTLKYKVSR